MNIENLIFKIKRFMVFCCSMSLTELDKDVYVAIKKEFNSSQYTEVSRWIEQMGTLLQIEYVSMFLL